MLIGYARVSTVDQNRTTKSLFSVQFAADGQRGWAVGEDGTILATEPYRVSRRL
jgi:photosystem II stability/assembly factor-like uncharacterized protein